MELDSDNGYTTVDTLETTELYTWKGESHDMWFIPQQQTKRKNLGLHWTRNEQGLKKRLKLY